MNKTDEEGRQQMKEIFVDMAIIVGRWRKQGIEPDVYCCGLITGVVATLLGQGIDEDNLSRFIDDGKKAGVEMWKKFESEEDDE